MVHGTNCRYYWKKSTCKWTAQFRFILFKGQLYFSSQKFHFSHFHIVFFSHILILIWRNLIVSISLLYFTEHFKLAKWNSFLIFKNYFLSFGYKISLLLSLLMLPHVCLECTHLTVSCIFSSSWFHEYLYPGLWKHFWVDLNFPTLDLC